MTETPPDEKSMRTPLVQEGVRKDYDAVVDEMKGGREEAFEEEITVEIGRTEKKMEAEVCPHCGSTLPGHSHSHKFEEKEIKGDDVKKLLKEEETESKGKKKGEEEKKESIAMFYAKNLWVVTLIGVYILFFIALSMLVKLQNETFAKVRASPPTAYSHPFSQTIFVFIGKIICCLVPSWIYTGINRMSNERLFKPKKDKKPVNMFIFMIPAIFNTLSTSFMVVGLFLTYASIVMMMRSIVVLTTFLLSIVMLKRKFYKLPHKWIGVFLVLVGVMVIGLDVALFPEGEGQATVGSPFLGTVFALLSVLLNSCMYVSEEWLLSDYDTGPIQVPGYEGLWGLLFLLLTLFILYLIPGNDYGSAENFPAALTQVFNDPIIFFCTLIFIPTIGSANILGNLITKYLTSATRAVVNQIPPVIVWVIQMLRGRQEFQWLQLVGYIFVVIGFLIYNEVGFNLAMPFYYDWYTAIKKKDAEAKKKKDAEKLKKKLEKEEVAKKEKVKKLMRAKERKEEKERQFKFEQEQKKKEEPDTTIQADEEEDPYEFLE